VKVLKFVVRNNKELWMKVEQCVSFLLLKGGRVLLEKRSKHKETDPGLITIPGGHIESGESQIQALYRELEEELNVVPKQYEFLCSLYHPTSELQLIHYYVVSTWENELVVREAEEVVWYPLASAPVEIKADELALSECQRLSRHLQVQV